MNRYASLIIAAALIIAAPCFAQDVTPTNYVPNYVSISSTCTNTGETGLSTGVAYACFAVVDIDDLTEASASYTNGDIRAIVYSLNQEFYDQWAALGTNAPTKVAITESVSGSSASRVIVNHNIRTYLSIGSTSVEGE